MFEIRNTETDTVYNVLHIHTEFDRYGQYKIFALIYNDTQIKPEWQMVHLNNPDEAGLWVPYYEEDEETNRDNVNSMSLLNQWLSIPEENNNNPFD